MAAARALAAKMPRSAGLCVRFDGWGDDSLETALRGPAILCLDERCSGEPLPPPSLGLTLWISTRAATRHNVASAFTAALFRRAAWIAAKRFDIETVLQEALGNAVVHGNLGIDSALRCSLEGLAEYCRRMDEGVADPVRAALPVIIHAEWSDSMLTLSVEDRGAGFDPAACPPPTPEAMCGRGIATMRSLCDSVTFANHGRKVTMVLSA